ncbi:MAG: S-adenosyl-l-methionine hydroxide adenosyltransferase family protein [Desulfomonilaceae bacterium]
MAGIITLTSDFGDRDGFVAQMKGVILGISPDAVLIDTTHSIEPFSSLDAALVVNGFFRYFPAGSIHLVVVDPGVGSNRRGIVVRSSGHYFVGPDNGVFSLIYSSGGPVRVRKIENSGLMVPKPHPTFHGRDVFAPVAAHLSKGTDFSEIGPIISDPERIYLPRVIKLEQGIEGKVIHVDRFGNLSVNIGANMLERPVDEINLGSLKIKKLSRTFSDVPDHEPLALINSFELLEIAINKRSAADSLGVGIGARVRVTWQDENVED